MCRRLSTAPSRSVRKATISSGRSQGHRSSLFALNAEATQLAPKAEGAGYSQAKIVALDGGRASLDGLATAFDAQTASSGVCAHVSSRGGLAFANLDAAVVTICGDLLATRGTVSATRSLTAALRTSSVSFASPAGRCLNCDTRG